MTKEEAKKILTRNFNLISTEILKEAAEKILSELDRAEEKIFKLEENFIKNLPDEEWRDVVGYEGIYKVSNMGRVKSFHNGKIYLLNLSNCNEYSSVALYKKGQKPKRTLVHILVAKTFIPNPKNLPEVNHKDGNKSNNCVENLEWVTSSQNKFHAIKLNLNPNVGVNHYRAKLNADEVRYIRNNYKPRDPEFGCKALAKKFKINE